MSSEAELRVAGAWRSRLRLDAIASRRVGLEPAPEPAGEAGPVCVATNVGVLAAQRVDEAAMNPRNAANAATPAAAP